MVANLTEIGMLFFPLYQLTVWNHFVCSLRTHPGASSRGDRAEIVLLHGSIYVDSATGIGSVPTYAARADLRAARGDRRCESRNEIA